MKISRTLVTGYKKNQSKSELDIFALLPSIHNAWRLSAVLRGYKYCSDSIFQARFAHGNKGSIRALGSQLLSD